MAACISRYLLITSGRLAIRSTSRKLWLIYKIMNFPNCLLSKSCCKGANVEAFRLPINIVSWTLITMRGITAACRYMQLDFRSSFSWRLCNPSQNMPAKQFLADEWRWYLHLATLRVINILRSSCVYVPRRKHKQSNWSVCISIM